MEETQNSPFLETWTDAMIIGAFLMLLTGVVIYVFHQIRVSSISDFKARYDYINTREVKHYRWVFLCFGLAVLMAINLYGMGETLDMGLWFFIRLFISVAGGTLVVYVAFLILEYYYPTVLNRKLRKLRYATRTSSAGNPMRLLSEDEEDVHLEEGMKAEENVFSIDYDVWLDEKLGEIKIEKYSGHLQALECNSCGFFTMRVVREEITRQPGPGGPGELIKHYQCQYCKAVRKTAFNISNKEVDDYRNDLNKPSSLKRRSSIELIRLEIHSLDAGKKFYEFPNLDQTLKFLQELEVEK